jgi:hypothetical protein
VQTDGSMALPASVAHGPNPVRGPGEPRETSCGATKGGPGQNGRATADETRRAFIGASGTEPRRDPIPTTTPPSRRASALSGYPSGAATAAAERLSTGATFDGAQKGTAPSEPGAPLGARPYDPRTPSRFNASMNPLTWRRSSWATGAP